jgi:hypothetical protein
MHQGLSANADALGAPLMRRLDERAVFTELAGQLRRHDLIPAHLAASRQTTRRLDHRLAGPGLV